MIIIEMILALINKLGIIIILAVIVSKIGIFRKLITKKDVGVREKIVLALFFGLVGIMGTYSSVPIYGALANTRVVGVMVGALLGGPLVGLLSGIIAGGHRYLIDIGGFTAFACAVSTIVEGLIGGYGYYYIKNKRGKWQYAFFIGVFAEIVQMVIILLLVRPFWDALELVKIILLPMVLVNSLGISIFIGIIENIYTEYERIAASQAEKALKIANLTLPYLRKGLNYSVAQKVVEIIYASVDVAAVAITDDKEILAHKGIGEDHHAIGALVQTEVTKDVIQKGKFKIIENQKDIQCNRRDCQLKSAIIVPLKDREQVVGTLKLYKKDENSITSVDIELALGLAQLFSTQIELSKLDYQKKLLIESELKTLQAQINPHFLFNAINTIVSFMQFDTIKAKNLLISLADLFRKSLKSNQDMVDIETELAHIASYLEIEKARFGDRLKVAYELDETITCKLPPLILQPIVENAVIHGILPKKNGGSVTIRSRKQVDDVLLEVIDDGVGIETEKVKALLKGRGDDKSVGLTNVNRRLVNLYGKDYQLAVESMINGGTSVKIRIPSIISRG
ncbi:LytS/YhcK type 5TM receptor domain-containing protein [Alkaliphilus crotonatoxidans]